MISIYLKRTRMAAWLIVLMINLLLLLVYAQRQGRYTFGFIRALYEEHRQSSETQAAPDGEYMAK